MTDIAAISGVLSSITGMKTIAEGLLAARDISTVSSKVIELQSKIIELQNGVFAIQAERMTLAEKASMLEKQIADSEKWDAEKEKYELVEIAPGVFGYMPNLKSENASVPHWLCQTCFEKKKKTILQFFVQSSGGSIYQCVPCGTKFTMPHRHGPRDTKRTWSSASR